MMTKIDALLLSGILFGFTTLSIAQPAFVWGKQFGTPQADAGQDIVVCGNGDVVLAGSTAGNLFADNLGGRDGFVVKFDSTGKQIWQAQFGSDQDDKIWELEQDRSGNLYAAGTTAGTINGQGFGNQDILIAQYSTDGSLLKTKIIGTDSTDFLSEIYIDDAYNIYIAGNTKGALGKTHFGNWDYFVMKLDSSFNEIFCYQFGTEQWDYCNDFIVDADNNFYLAGFTFGKIGQQQSGETDAFLAKYSEIGEELKSLQFGTEKHENISNLIMDTEGHLFISGSTHGNLVGPNSGKSDVFLMHLNTDWQPVWQQQFGTPSWDEAWHMQLTPDQSHLLLSGSHNPDAYIRLYTTEGELQWNQKFTAKAKAGTGGRHFALHNASVYFTGFTFADLFSSNPNPDVDDVLLVRLGMEEMK